MIGTAWVRPRRGALLAALVALECCAAASRGFRDTPHNNYSLFADALVHGRLWIDWPGPYIDAVLWNGHHYIVNDPLPGILLVPFAFFPVLHANQTVVGSFFAAFGTYVAYRLARRLGTPRTAAILLTAFYFAGTDLFWCASLGDVWFVAQACAMPLLTAAIYEIVTRRRPVVVAVLFALAVLARFTIVLSAPALALFFVWSIDGERLARSRRAILQFTAALVPFAIGWMVYNQVRWGLPYDRGHTIFFHQDAAAGAPIGSPFAFSHLLYQLYSFFIQAPSYRDQFPYLIPSISGVALTFTSPALLLAATVRRPLAPVVACVIATLLAAGPSLLYYVNGYAQYGMRHAMDFEPYLFVLMILAVRRRLSGLAVVSIVWSVCAGAYGVWYWQTYVHT